MINHQILQFLILEKKSEQISVFHWYVVFFKNWEEKKFLVLRNYCKIAGWILIKICMNT